MDDFTLALIIIGDMTLTERKLRGENEALKTELSAQAASDEHEAPVTTTDGTRR